jgi:hypothetical protein
MVRFSGRATNGCNLLYNGSSVGEAAQYLVLVHDRSISRRSMRQGFSLTAMAIAVAMSSAPACAQMDHEVHKVENGGIHVKGWSGVVDASAVASGQSINDARLTQEGKDLHIMTGPAATYWNTSKPAKGSYTVSAKFTEPQYMNLNDHPHPYGIVIGGNELGTANGTYLYCAAYGNGSFIVRGMGPAPFALGGRRPQVNAAVNKAEEKGKPVTQTIAVKVSPDKVDCIINGTTVASYPMAEVVGAGRLKSTDGFYGIRSAHNTEVVVSGFSGP